MLHEKALITVESLGGDHPVQKAMVELHGSQCGFCTPGIVMSLYARTLGATGTFDTDPKDVLAGNLCRCTGYGPILEAARANPFNPSDNTTIAAQLNTIQNPEPLEISGWTAPKTTDQLAQILTERPDARIVAGATDVGLWVTKQHRSLAHIVYVGDIADLSEIYETPEGLTLGAGARYSDALEAMTRLHPSMGELVRRIGAVQVRNSGTIGGNIANGSPIGDMPPALIALNATVTLRRGEGRRTIPLEDFFVAYGQQDRQPGEFVESVFVPRPTGIYRVVKLSKRFDSDISAVCGAFHVTVADGIVTAARIAFGGMAGTPKRAKACEAALTGQPWSQATLDAAAQALSQDYQPLSDVRGSSDYRLVSAANLVRKLWFDGASVLDVRPVDA
ncbi:xanthine dehydrogenase, small subunit [Asticcacaulis biprosthecium C19]|uniref:Xanthine dehydrogenase, small subunit n=1 Tax=Asticcacaulis biprosthecium C19 TaxID=715226 RepID=F4QN24_9CAUL|nr:xanthine dehydrogenase small subunit [Asticcacaulis biprosthecium]EGF91615.1 xanthine dehydrogenase, small subunit [Asticcacaulis biprosthecium C19]